MKYEKICTKSKLWDEDKSNTQYSVKKIGRKCSFNTSEVKFWGMSVHIATDIVCTVICKQPCLTQSYMLYKGSVLQQLRGQNTQKKVILNKICTTEVCEMMLTQ